MNKYHAKKVICPIDGKFDSKLEYERWCFLKLMERTGEITGLQRQVTYRLEVFGNLVCKFIADHVYYMKNRKIIVEDTKGIMTPSARLKHKLFAAINGYPVTVIKKAKDW